MFPDDSQKPDALLQAAHGERSISGTLPAMMTANDERNNYDDHPERRRSQTWLILVILGALCLACVVPFLAIVLFLVALGNSNM